MDPRLPVLGAVFLVSAINLALALVVGLKGRGQRGHRAFVAFLLTLWEWSFVYGVYLLLPAAAPGKLVFANLQYAGVAAAPLLFLLFALRYAGRDPPAWKGWRCLFAGLPLLLNLLVWTDPWHHLLRRGVRVVEAMGLEVLDPSFGPLLWIFVACSYAALLAATVLLVGAAARARGGPRTARLFLLLLATAAPWLASAVDLLGLVPGPFDPVHVGFMVTGICLAVITIRYGLFLIGAERIAQSILESMSDVVILLDAEARISRCNPALTAVLGYRPAEVADRHVSRLLAEPAWEQIDPLSPAAGLPTRSFEGQLTSKDGGRTPVLLSVTPFRSEHGLLHGYLLVARDLRERQRAEEERRRADRLEAVRSLAGGVAHDFNNVLTAAALRLHVLETRLPPGDPLLEQVRALKQALGRASTQTEQLLLIGGQSFHPVPCELNAFLRQALAELAGASATRPAVLLQPAPRPLPVLLDPALMRRCLAILMNEIRPAETGGNPRLVASFLPQTAGGRACVEMPGPARRAAGAAGRTAFEPYQRTPHAIDTDLELSAAQAILSLHGGWLERREPEGVLRILLPLSGA